MSIDRSSWPAAGRSVSPICNLQKSLLFSIDHWLTHTHTQLTGGGGIMAASYFRSRRSWCSARRNLLILPLRLRVVRMQSPRHKSALFPYRGAAGPGREDVRRLGRSSAAGRSPGAPRPPLGPRPVGRPAG